MTAWVLCGVGSLFVVIGTVGMLRFRDVFSRLQASGVADNAGLGLILVGLIAHRGWAAPDWSLLVLVVLLLVTNPIATHSIAKSAFTQGHGKASR
ncbi:MAG: monovalent cation/H(+) antiporter subunit G [Candidatus Bipolaricaulota bacterium]|nr:MAG: monovalent cation/H(+) antiporter subunit G [Candidatus Bipolaricaulota bacterium]